MRTHSDRQVAFGAAAFGGVATSLFALAADLTHGKGTPDARYLLGYSVGLAIFAGMGALVAYLFEETNFRKAFFLGLSLPSLIQAGTGNAEHALADQPPGSARSAFDLLPVAYAQAPDQTAAGRRLKVVAPAGTPAYEVVFFSADGKQEQRLTVDGGTTDKVVGVPDYATRFELRVSGSRSESQPLDAAAVTVVNLTAQGNALGGLQRSLGVSHVDRYVVSVKKVQSR